MRTLAKSNGDAMSEIELTGSDRSAATESSDMIPPRHQPTTCTSQSPPASLRTASIAFGITSSTQCSSPSCRSANPIGP